MTIPSFWVVGRIERRVRVSRVTEYGITVVENGDPANRRRFIELRTWNRDKPTAFHFWIDPRVLDQLIDRLREAKALMQERGL